MQKIWAALTSLWSSEPVAIMTALVVIINTVVAAAHGSLSWATAVQDVVATISALLVRRTVTAPANLAPPAVPPTFQVPTDLP